METHKCGKVALLVSGALFITACSKEEQPPVPNTPPSIVFETSSLSVNEGDVLRIPFSVTDAETSVQDLRVTLNLNDMQGDVRVDRSTNELVYTAPWVSEGTGFSETFIVDVFDSENLTSSGSVTVSVQDINDPVKIVITPPQLSFGFENTQTDTNLSLFFPEEKELVVEFSINEPDADIVTVDYGVTEGVVFRNQITPTLSENSALATLSLPIPDIQEPSETFALQLTVMDGDDTVDAIVNVTVINKVALAWRPNQTSDISESSGGSLIYNMSEPYAYPAEYTVSFHELNGDPVERPINYSFTPANGTVTFGEQDGFLGDRQIVMNLSVSNIITSASGEEFRETVELSRTLVLRDDRDDGFSSLTEQFYDTFEQLTTSNERDEEGRVVSIVGSYLYLNRLVTKSEREVFVTHASTVYTDEITALTSAGATLSNRLNSGESGPGIESSIESFFYDLKSMGKDTRTYVSEYINTLDNGSVAQGLPFNLPSMNSEIFVASSELSHYVGNKRYGFYVDQAKTDWEFTAEYAYLDVVNYTDSFCF
jgi:hypothetical protein